MLIHPHLTFVLYDKVVGEGVSPDTDILLVDEGFIEADIVVGEGDLVQAEQTEEEGCKDEIDADSPLLHIRHPNLSFLKLEQQDWTLSSAVELL